LAFKIKLIIKTMINFVYDPKRQGYDTNLFKTLAGTPSVASDKIVLNAAEIVGYADMVWCDLTMRLIIPAVPTAGDVRKFGLASASLGAILAFEINDDVFTISAADGDGNTKSSTITFDAALAAVSADFTIRWRGSYADFLINGVPVITPGDMNGSTYRLNDIAVPNGPLSMYFQNSNADNMQIVNIEGKNIQTFL
jgi:hypothetical protein